MEEADRRPRGRLARPTRTASSTRSPCRRAPGVDQGEALALRAKDGKLLWRFPLPGAARPRRSSIGSNVIVGSESGDIYALDRKTGKPDWQVHTAGAVKGGLAFDDGVLYGANYAGQVFALRASNGQYVWQSSTQGLELRPRRARLLDPGGRLRARLPRLDRHPRLLLRPGHRRAALEPLDRRLGLRRAGGRRHAEDRADRLRRLQGPELLRARREDRRGALAAATSAA